MVDWKLVGAVVIGGLALGAIALYVPKSGFLLPGGKA